MEQGLHAWVLLRGVYTPSLLACQVQYIVCVQYMRVVYPNKFYGCCSSI